MFTFTAVPNPTKRNIQLFEALKRLARALLVLSVLLVPAAAWAQVL